MFSSSLEYTQEEYRERRKKNGDLDKVNEICNCAIYIQIGSNHAFRNKRLKYPTSFYAAQRKKLQMNWTFPVNLISLKLHTNAIASQHRWFCWFYPWKAVIGSIMETKYHHLKFYVMNFNSQPKNTLISLAGDWIIHLSQRHKLFDGFIWFYGLKQIKWFNVPWWSRLSAACTRTPFPFFPPW